jgi:hypothetical protein
LSNSQIPDKAKARLWIGNILKLESQAIFVSYFFIAPLKKYFSYYFAHEKGPVAVQYACELSGFGKCG